MEGLYCNICIASFPHLLPKSSVVLLYNIIDCSRGLYIQVPAGSIVKVKYICAMFIPFIRETIFIY